MDDLDLDGGEIGGTVQWEPVPDWFGLGVQILG